MTFDTDAEETELQVATRQNSLQKVKDALAQSFNPNELSHLYQWAPLHEAISNGNLKIVKILLQYGADPNLPDALQGNTPLHYAAKRGKLDILKVLVERFNANTNTRNINGERAVEIAVKDCKVYLKNKGKEQLDELAPHPSMDVFHDGVFQNVFQNQVKTRGKEVNDSGVGSSDESMTPSVGSAHSSGEMTHQKSTSSVSGLGNVKLRFIFNNNRGILTIFPEEVADLVIDQGKMCNLSHVYIKTYLLPDLHHGTKLKTEVIKIGSLMEKRKRGLLPAKQLTKKMKSAFKKSSHDSLSSNSKEKRATRSSNENLGISILNVNFDRSLEYKGVHQKIVESRTVQVNVCGKPSSTGAKTRILGSVVIPVAVAIKKSGESSEWYPLSIFIGPVKSINKEVETQLNESYEKTDSGKFTGRSLAWSGSGSLDTFSFTRTLPTAPSEHGEIEDESSEDKAYSGKYSRHCRTKRDRLVCQEMADEEHPSQNAYLNQMTSSQDLNEKMLSVNRGIEESLRRNSRHVGKTHNSSQKSTILEAFSNSEESDSAPKVEAFIIEKNSRKPPRPISFLSSPQVERVDKRTLPMTLYQSRNVPAPILF